MSRVRLSWVSASCSSQDQRRLALYLIYAVLIGAGVSGGSVPLMSTVARWFRARRGMMTGVVMAGVGVGTMAVPPFADWLIRTLSWRSSFVVVGLLLMVVIPIAGQFLKRDPAANGAVPARRRRDCRRTSADGRLHRPLFSDAMRTPQLWLLVAAFAGFGWAVHSVMVHVVVHATGLGLSPSLAAGIMTAIGALGVVGRIGTGSLADQRGAKRLLVAQYGLLALSLLWLAAARDAWSIFACALLFGFAFGGIVPLNSHIIADLFGLRAHGAVLGVTGLSIGVGSAIVPSSPATATTCWEAT
jgi:MFS family permease